MYLISVLPEHAAEVSTEVKASVALDLAIMVLAAVDEGCYFRHARNHIQNVLVCMLPQRLLVHALSCSAMTTQTNRCRYTSVTSCTVHAYELAAVVLSPCQAASDASMWQHDCDTSASTHVEVSCLHRGCASHESLERDAQRYIWQY